MLRRSIFTGGAETCGCSSASSDLFCVVQCGQQVHLGPGRPTAAQCPAVDRDHSSAGPGQTRPAEQPAAPAASRRPRRHQSVPGTGCCRQVPAGPEPGRGPAATWCVLFRQRQDSPPHRSRLPPDKTPLTNSVRPGHLNDIDQCLDSMRRPAHDLLRRLKSGGRCDDAGRATGRRPHISRHPQRAWTTWPTRARRPRHEGLADTWGPSAGTE